MRNLSSFICRPIETIGDEKTSEENLIDVNDNIYSSKNLLKRKRGEVSYRKQ